MIGENDIILGPEALRTALRQYLEKHIATEARYSLHLTAISSVHAEAVEHLRVTVRAVYQPTRLERLRGWLARWRQDREARRAGRPLAFEELSHARRGSAMPHPASAT